MYKRLLIAAIILFLAGSDGAFGNPADTSGFKQAEEDIKVVIYNEGAAVDWLAVQRSIQLLGSLKDSGAAELMAGVLRRKTPLDLVKGAPLPGVMPPLEMLKTAAIDALVELHASKYVPEIREVSETTKFEILKNSAQKAIGALQR